MLLDMLLELNNLTIEDLEPQQNNTELAQLAYINSELCLALIEEMEM